MEEESGAVSAPSLIRPALTRLAPAKVNLYLHITGKRPDGYHLLDSLVVFADVGDEIVLTPGDVFQVTLSGPFADQVDQRPDLVETAARRLSSLLDKPLDFSISVTKEIPVGAGLGGGSSDAATALRLMCRHWKVRRDTPEILRLAEELGADVPICFDGKAASVDGVGERFYPALGMPSLPGVLVNPGKSVSTPSVFKAYDGRFRDPDRAHVLPKTPKAMAGLLSMRTNMLYQAAISVEPEIAHCLEALEGSDALLSRMSGSGATCVALYETDAAAKRAAAQIAAGNPAWWVRACTLS